MRFLIFLQPLGRALKNQNAAPATPPCFSRWLRSSSLLFKSSYPQLLLKGNCHVKQKRQWTVCLPVDIPTCWEPRAKQQPTGLIAYGAARRRPVQVLFRTEKEKPVHIVYWFFFFVCAMEGARTGRRRIAPQAISPVGCCLARGFQRVGMSTVEAVNRKISWLFCFSGRVCTLLHISCTLYKKAMKSLHRLHSVYFAAQKLSLSGRGPDKLGGIGNKGYHGLRRASRWFCKFYCGKAVIVGLIS